MFYYLKKKNKNKKNILQIRRSAACNQAISLIKGVAIFGYQNQLTIETFKGLNPHFLRAINSKLKKNKKKN